MPAVNVVEMSAAFLAKARAAATRTCRPIRSQRPDKMATAAAWLASGWTRTSLQEPVRIQRIVTSRRCTYFAVNFVTHIEVFQSLGSCSVIISNSGESVMLCKILPNLEHS